MMGKVVYNVVNREDDEEPERARSSSSVYNPYSEPGVPEGPVHLQEASSLSCYINLTNTIIGAGVLSLPYAVAYSGSVLGAFLITISGIAQIFSLHLLSICAAKVPFPSSFYSVTQASVPSLTVLIDLAVAIQSFGVCSSYLIVISDLMPDVMEKFNVGGVWRRRHLWTVIGFLIVAPLSTLKKLDALKYTSGLCVVFIAFLTCMVLLFGIPGDGWHPCDLEDDDGDCVGERPLLSIDNNTFRVFSIFTNAYSCQSNIFGVVNEIRNRTQARVDGVSFWAILTSGVVYGTVALAGFYTYGRNVDSNILITYPQTTVTTIGRLFVTLLVAFSYPIMFLPGRNSMLGLWRFFDRDENAWIAQNKFRYIVITILMLGGSLITSLEIKDLGVVFALVGATGATVVSFTLPGAAYYAMHSRSFRDDAIDQSLLQYVDPGELISTSGKQPGVSSSGELEGPRWKLYGAAALVVTGCILTPVCLVFIFI